MVIKFLNSFCLIFLALLLALTFKNYFNLTELDKYNIVEKRASYPPEVSRLFHNKLTESFTISRKQIFSYLNTDQLFRLFTNEK